WFYRFGCDVILLTLPFHGSRQMRRSLFSGYGYFVGGPSWVNESIAHSVSDLRVLMNWLATERGVDDVGVTGVSLGAFTSAVAASVDSRLRFAIPNVPVVSLADIVLEWQPLGSLARAVMKAGRF